MTAYTCPKGHPSETDDFCDTCGARILAVPAALPATGTPCPHCGAPQVGMGRFCEDCGFDHSTGKGPAVATFVPAAPEPAEHLPSTFVPAALVPAAGLEWTATVAVDRVYFEENGIEGVEFPAETPSRHLTLPPPQVRIGRASVSKGTRPEIDLADTDPGVSHSHALLTLNVDGVWLLTDQGSTNGTFLNDEQEPLPAGHTRELGDGDEVHVGAWTTITLHAP